MATKSLKQLSRARLDRALSLKFEQLAPRGRRWLAFDNLLHHVRNKSSLLRVHGDGSDQLLAVEALFNISHWHHEFVEWPSTWRGGTGDVYAQILSLAVHVFGGHAAPRNFALVWLGGHSIAELETRRWFIEHARGRRFRDVPNLPMQMTRKMESILLNSPHHLPLRPAMRRAEVLALGGEPQLVEAILATPLAQQFGNGEFWRSAIQFFVRYWDELDTAQIADYVDKLDAVRHRPLRIFTRNGERVLGPPDPCFSLAGRTPKTVLREIAQRMLAHLPRPEPHQSLPSTWPSLGLPEFAHIDNAGHWRMFELGDVSALRREGADMHHCVSSYWQRCTSGYSSIWSLRLLAEDGQAFASRCTVEVNPHTRTVVQIRGHHNQPVNTRVRTIIERWIAEVGLALAAHAWPTGQLLGQ